MKKSYKVEIDCANCAAKIQDAVNKIDGIDSAIVNFMTQKLIIEGDKAGDKALVKQIEKVGKKVDSDFEIYA